VFLLAGYDTTSNMLAYASFELAHHTDCQQRLLNEIDECCALPLTYDGVQQMTYLDMVVKETMRMYPLASLYVCLQCARAHTCAPSAYKVVCVQRRARSATLNCTSPRAQLLLPTYGRCTMTKPHGVTTRTRSIQKGMYTTFAYRVPMMEKRRQKYMKHHF
jgi:hypothetical protein